MSAVIISTDAQYTHGRATNQAVSNLLSVAAALERLSSAIETATSGYAGVPGTEFEIPTDPMAQQSAYPNLFGVLANATPGQQGSAYSYAVGRLHELWAPFWAEAKPYVEQLDNGT